MLATLRRYLRIAVHFARVGVIRKSQFRVEFFSQVVMDCVWYTVHVSIFEILFGHAESIAGWHHSDVRVFLGFLFVSDAFMMMWLGSHWRFGRDLKDGKLDPVRVRPATPIFLYFFQSFSPEAVFNMAVGLGYLIYALDRAGLPLGGLTVPVLLWAILLACWARLLLAVLFSTFEFYVLNSEIGKTMDRMFSAASDRPLDIFTRRVRMFFLYLVPVGVLTHAPASMVLGRVGPGEALLHSIWIFALGLAVFRFWNWSFHRYESAMG